MRTCWATFRRNWLVIVRAYPWTYFVGTLATGILTVGLAVLAYRAVGGGRVATGFPAAAGTADYLGFVTVGAAALMFTVRMVLWVAKAQITEQREGTLESHLLTPARRLPYLIGVAGQALTTTLAEVAVMLVVAVVVGVRLPTPAPVTLIAAVLAATVAVFGIAVPLSAVMIAVGEAHITQNTVFVGMGLLCGFTFPTAYLPGPARWLGEALPVTAALRALRAATLHGAGLAEAMPALLTCVALGAGYLLTGLLVLPFAERYAVQRSATA
jgi:ABC-2 type transport system permease protein